MIGKSVVSGPAGRPERAFGSGPAGSDAEASIRSAAMLPKRHALRKPFRTKR
jgi:hypothetical protein